MKFIVFPAKPPLPPSQTQLVERVNKANNEKPDFFQSLKVLMTNKPFLIHMVAYGINVAVFSALGTYLNQFTLAYFPVRQLHEKSVYLLKYKTFV